MGQGITVTRTCRVVCLCTARERERERERERAISSDELMLMMNDSRLLRVYYFWCMCNTMLSVYYASVSIAMMPAAVYSGSLTLKRTQQGLYYSASLSDRRRLDWLSVGVVW